MTAIAQDYNQVGRGFAQAGDDLRNFFGNVFINLSRFGSAKDAESGTTGKVAEVAVHIIQAVGYALGQTVLGVLKLTLDRMILWIDTFSSFSFINYFIQGKFKEDQEHFTLIGNIAGAGIFTSGICLALSEFEIVNFGGIAAAIGNIPVIGALANISLVQILLGFIIVNDLANVFKGFWTLGDNSITAEQKTKTWINIIQNITDIAFRAVWIAIGTANLPLFIALGLTSSLLGISGFLYEKNTEVKPS